METRTLPQLKKHEVDEIIDCYRSIYQRETNLIKARARKQHDLNIIHTEWIQRDLIRKTKLKISRSFITDKNYEKCSEIETNNISDCALSALSNSGKLKAVIRRSNSGKDAKYFLEVWTQGRCSKVLDLTALEIHGAVHVDGHFASLSWSEDEKKILYIAEEKSKKTWPFYPSYLREKEGSSSAGRGQEFVYEDDWGETMDVGEAFFPKKQPVIVMVDVNTENVTVLEGIPADISPGQVIWEPYNKGVIGVGFMNEPKRLGLLFCTNRRCHIFHLSSAGNYTVLSDENMAVYSPRFSPDKNHLIWVQRPYSGTTHAAHCIMKYHWITKEKSILLDIVENSIITKNGKEFFGIYSFSLTSRCWSSNGRYLLFSTPQRYRINTYAVDIKNGDIWDIGSSDENQSTILLEVTDDDYILCNLTSYKEPSVLAAINLPRFDSDFLVSNVLSWNVLTEQLEESNKIFNFSVYDEREKKETCFATYYGPVDLESESVPVVLYTHGGPHISVPSAYTPVLSFFTALGFGVVVVHYRGSWGNGQTYIDSLVGKIASLDVEDCYSALQTALKKFPFLDPHKVVLYGGSYGGSVNIHLIAQHPNDYRAIATRNPIVDVYLRCFLSDINDWSFVENGLEYKGFTKIFDNADIVKNMMDVSPINYMKNVNIPTLFLLGKYDKRYPPGPSVACYNILKEMGVPTKILFYDDNHNLFSVAAEMDSTINTAIWFIRSLKTEVDAIHDLICEKGDLKDENVDNLNNIME